METSPIFVIMYYDQMADKAVWPLAFVTRAAAEQEFQKMKLKHYHPYFIKEIQLNKFEWDNSSE